MLRFRVAIGIGSPISFAGADEEADFQFVVERAAGSEHRRCGGGVLGLSDGRWNGDRRSRRSTMPGRDSRWARTCSSAAADCPGGTTGRRWWRGGWTRRNRCNRRCARASSFRLRSSESAEARRQLAVRRRRAQQFGKTLAQRRPMPRAERHQGIESKRRNRHPRFLAVSSSSRPVSAARSRSRIWSPMATPMASEVLLLNKPKGRF